MKMLVKTYHVDVSTGSMESLTADSYWLADLINTLIDKGMPIVISQKYAWHYSTETNGYCLGLLINDIKISIMTGYGSFDIYNYEINERGVWSNTNNWFSCKTHNAINGQVEYVHTFYILYDDNKVFLIKKGTTTTNGEVPANTQLMLGYDKTKNVVFCGTTLMYADTQKSLSYYTFNTSEEKKIIHKPLICTFNTTTISSIEDLGIIAINDNLAFNHFYNIDEKTFFPIALKDNTNTDTTYLLNCGENVETEKEFMRIDAAFVAS